VNMGLGERRWEILERRREERDLAGRGVVERKRMMEREVRGEHRDMVGEVVLVLES